MPATSLLCLCFRIESLLQTAEGRLKCYDGAKVCRWHSSKRRRLHLRLDSCESTCLPAGPEVGSRVSGNRKRRSASRGQRFADLNVDHADNGLDSRHNGRCSCPKGAFEKTRTDVSFQCGVGAVRHRWLSYRGKGAVTSKADVGQTVIGLGEGGDQRAQMPLEERSIGVSGCRDALSGAYAS